MQWTQESRDNREDQSAYEVMLDENGRVLFDTLNSEVAEIHFEPDEAGVNRWDEAGQKNFAAILKAFEEVEILRMALQESLKLQSHYASLLNDFDGGKRVGFRSVQEWIDRLKECKKLPR